NHLKRPSDYSDHNGHGTVVAGLIGALDNTIGIVGIAPGARLWSMRVLNRKGGGPTSGLLCGLDWITATRTDSDPTNDIAVANMSLVSENKLEEDGNCGLTHKDLIHQAICRSTAAGITDVVAAGNESVDFRTAHIASASYPEV